MDGKRFIRKIKIQNLLSFGNDGEELELGPLNVLIGPNASGKSNFIESIGLLQAASRNILQPVIDNGGGIEEWLWKGAQQDLDAQLNFSVDYPGRKIENPLHYDLTVGKMDKNAIHIKNEHIYEMVLDQQNGPFYYYQYDFKKHQGHGILQGLTNELHHVLGNNSIFHLPNENLSLFAEVLYLKQQLDNIRIYRQYGSLPPQSQINSGIDDEFLVGNSQNIGQIIHNTFPTDKAKAPLVKYLKKLYGDAESLFTRIEKNMVRVYIQESGLSDATPPIRLSYGTNRFLSLLAILCHPEPPPLVCIEEPELGMHPDIIPAIAELLIDASQRMQVVVTTHSDLLVSALSEVPESIVVCERYPQGTRMERLEPKQLQKWLEKYSLGELWQRGDLGARR